MAMVVLCVSNSIVVANITYYGSLTTCAVYTYVVMYDAVQNVKCTDIACNPAVFHNSRNIITSKSKINIVFEGEKFYN